MAETMEVTAEAEVRALLDEWVEGARAGDLDRIMSCYAPEILSFDAITELQFKGAEAYRAHWQTCLSYMQGGMLCEMHELAIETGGDIAFCHYLARCGATDTDGREHVGWLRATVCCRRIGAGWRIVHEHFSSPFDPESGKALMELAP